MKPLCLALALSVAPLPALAQTDQEVNGQQVDTAPDTDAAEANAPQGPVLRVDFPKTEAIPGQPLTLRLTVLVPSFMPAPPVWPTLDAPNLLVRLPEGATGPVSERIDGATWSGITRRYQISPMVPGSFSIPAQEVAITWRDPETGDDRRGTLATEPIAFGGIIPEGAEGLDPFLAAEALELTQEIEGDPATMRPGDSVTRTLTARVEGVSPMFLPDLLAPAQLEGVAAYPDEPALAESWDRGVPGGTRTERVTYVAEGGGGGLVPPVALEWYDIPAGNVETADLEGFEIVVKGPPASSGEPRDWRRLTLLALALAVGMALLAALGRWAGPRLVRRMQARRDAWLASERHAWQDLNRAVTERDNAAMRRALDIWAARTDGPDPRRHPDLHAALVRLGATRYAKGASSADAAAAWQAVADALPGARRASRTDAGAEGIPPLNFAG